MFDRGGILNILKPVGISSFGAVRQVRKRVPFRKVGHTGTLDPEAAGVLPICVGRATKIIPYFDEKTKEYICGMEFGKSTPTLDLESEIEDYDEHWHNLTKADIETVLKTFIGKSEQIPPMYSAIHHKGKRLYQLARKGIEVERKPRNINIHAIDLLELSLPDIKFKVVCAKGTYIRSLVRDIAQKLNTLAVMSSLVRTKSGPFSFEGGIPLNDFLASDEERFADFYLPLDYPLTFPTGTLKQEAEKKAENGVYLLESDFSSLAERFKENELISVYNFNNKFLSINRPQFDEEEGWIFKAERVFV